MSNSAKQINAPVLTVTHRFSRKLSMLFPPSICLWDKPLMQLIWYEYSHTHTYTYTYTHTQ